jgi:chorismate-pyruvate lyase
MSDVLNDLFPLVIVDTGLWKLDFTHVRIIPPDEVPEPYYGLLVHHHHMTVTVEAHYGRPVDVRVLEAHHAGNSYSREILLELQGTSQVVQFGIARINLACCSESVRAAILEGKTPLGRILIEHGVLRTIEPTAFLHIEPGPKLVEWFGLARPRQTYGRMGVIFCDDRPAIAVLEILAPIG